MAIRIPGEQDHRPADRAAFVLMSAMKSILTEARSERFEPANMAYATTWKALEDSVLPLLPDCNLKLMSTKTAAYLAGSCKIVAALPSRTSSKPAIDRKASSEIEEFMPVEAFALAIEKRLVEAKNIRRIFLHRQGDEAWTRYIEEVLSPVAMFSGRYGEWLWHRKGLSGLTDIDRLSRVLRAQARHHPEKMSLGMSTMLFSGMNSDLVPAALFLAGVKPRDNEPDSCTDNGREMQRLLASHHGNLQLVERYGSLEAVMTELCKPDLGDETE